MSSQITYVAESPDDAKDHPRNGYAETRMIFALAEGMLFPPPDAVLVINVVLADVYDRPRVSPGPPVSGSDLLPTPENWQGSNCLVRVIGRPIANAPDVEAVKIASEIWQGKVQPPHANGEDPGNTKQYFLEISACWSVTTGCDHCVNDAIERTALAAISFVNTLSEATTVASGIPFSPLPAHFTHESQAVWIKEFDLGGKLIRDHMIQEASQFDPRVQLIEELDAERAASGSGDEEKASEDLAVRVTQTLTVLTYGGDLASYYAFIAAASKSLYVESNYSTSVLLSAQACESLLDVVLLHMLWWDKEDFVQAGELLSDGVVKRVQSHFMRLRGTWDLNTSTPLRNWRTAVADKRNRVAHGGRSATFNEAKAALNAAKRLHTHLDEVVNTQHARGAYPALAGVLSPAVASTGTKKQREATKAYLDKFTRPYSAFRYYRALANRERWTANGNPIVPGEEHAVPLATVRKATEDIDWWLYDPETHHVVEAITPRLDPESRPLFLEINRRQIRSGLTEDTFPAGLDRPLAPVSGRQWRDALIALPSLSPVCTISP